MLKKVNKIDNVPDIDATELWNQILVDDRHKGYDFLDDADFKAKKITGMPEEEKFYNVLQNTTEVKKPSMDEAESTELNNIKELSQVDGGKPSSEKS